MTRHRNMLTAALLLLCAVWMSGCAAAVIGGAAVAGAGGYSLGKDERPIGKMFDDKGLDVVIEKDLDNDPLVGALGLSVYVYQGHVFIVGTKFNQEQEERVIKLADQYEATKSVDVYLVQVEKGQTAEQFASDSWTTSKVKTKFIGDSEIESSQINVTTVRCHVVLLGIVRNQQTIDKAVSVAKEINGTNPVKSFLMLNGETLSSAGSGSRPGTGSSPTSGSSSRPGTISESSLPPAK